MWILERSTGAVVDTVVADTRNDCTAAAILAMADHVPDLSTARAQYRLVDRRPPLGTEWQRRQIRTMPWGRYEGQPFDTIPWKYLDRVLNANLNLRDPILFDAIWEHLEGITEWQNQKFDEEYYGEQFNHLRDFDPDELRRNGGRVNLAKNDEIDDRAADPHFMRSRFVVSLRSGQPYDVRIDRSTEWGNPFRVGPDGDRQDVIRKYAEWIQRQPDLVERAKRELRGKVLACHCAPLPCHGHILAKIANS
jgi:hypothetical protein